ncbi:hypothetical protein [Frigoriglobus tundricola]|uniref:Uncharacterized protein n=1 Tax=Frigoriglobus tundricola TaxID=2774151 RepID=A0A6M5YUP7_9BACT|nr:hypothetical protein [Frigoriglobus tundricola]QJW97130.1 hypothetical protein FTUN_4695 [Frigoriglobus tundricola]
MAIAGVFMFVLLGVVLLSALFAGGALVRAAVRLTNRLLGPAKTEPVDPIEDWDWDGDLEPVPPRRRTRAGAVPVPTHGNGMMIAFLSALASGIVFALLAVLVEELDVGDAVPPGWVVLALVALTAPPGLAALTLLLVMLLPTTLLRAALIALVHHALALFVVLVVVSAVFLVAEVFG